MIRNKIKSNKMLSLLFSITAFLGLNPYFIWHGFSFIYYGFIALSVALFLTVYMKKNYRFRLKDLFVVLYLIILVLYAYHRNFEQFFKIIILNFSTVTFILMKKETKLLAFKYLTTIFAISLIPSVVVYILNLVGFDFNWEYLIPDSGKAQSGFYYRKYLGAVVLDSPRNPITGIYRLCGMYDEPGVVGTVSALLLAGNRFSLKDIWNKVILIGGILSISLAFYLLVIIYFILELFIAKKNKAVLILSGVLISILILSSGVFNNTFLEQKILSRIDYEDGKLSGSNRTTEAYDYEYNSFLNSGIKNVLLGVGEEQRLSKPYMASASSYKNRIYDSGFIGLFSLVFLFIILALDIKSRYTIIYFLVFLASMYQRADVLRFPYILVFVGSLYNLQLYNKGILHESIQERIRR